MKNYYHPSSSFGQVNQLSSMEGICNRDADAHSGGQGGASPVKVMIVLYENPWLINIYLLNININHYKINYKKHQKLTFTIPHQ